MLGRVARRIWAVAMKEKYGADERSQKLKYHVQTSRPVAARAGDGLQRHPHHAAGAHRDLRQRQQPAHQRLRRGGHHPDRGVGAPGAGDPADHQPRVGPGDEREPAPGLVHHRRAHRPRRGGRARRVRRGSTSAAACSARWRPATSAAGSRTSRCSTSTASTTARCRSSASTPSVKPRRRRARPHEVELARATEAEKESQLRRRARLPGRARRRGARRRSPGSRTAAIVGRERLRRADGRRPGLLAAAGHRGVLRGRRASTAATSDPPPAPPRCALPLPGSTPGWVLLPARA